MAINLRENHDCRLLLQKHLTENLWTDVKPQMLIEISDFLLEWERGQKADTGDRQLTIPVVSERTFYPSDRDVEDIAKQIDVFILMYGRTKKAATYSMKIRTYIANILNQYVR